MFIEPFEERELVGELVAVDRIAVRGIDGGDPHPGGENLQITRVGIVFHPGQAALFDIDRAFGEDGDAVIGLLPEDRDVIAEILDLGARELLFEALEFLQQNDIGAELAQPLLQVGGAGPDRVHVPGGDFDHARPS